MGVRIEMSVNSDAKRFLKGFASAVLASVPEKYTGTVTVELHFHQGGLSRVTKTDKENIDLNP